MSQSLDEILERLMEFGNPNFGREDKECITAKQAIEALIAERERLARIDENEQALYLFENQADKGYALIGKLAGSDKDLSKGIFVETESGRSVVLVEDVDFSLPQFFKDRISKLQQPIAPKVDNISNP